MYCTSFEVKILFLFLGEKQISLEVAVDVSRTNKCIYHPSLINVNKENSFHNSSQIKTIQSAERLCVLDLSKSNNDNDIKRLHSVKKINHENESKNYEYELEKRSVLEVNKSVTKHSTNSSNEINRSFIQSQIYSDSFLNDDNVLKVYEQRTVPHISSDSCKPSQVILYLFFL